MVASNFTKSLNFVLQSEGGNDDDPADHGGRTSRGITQREYDAWRRENHKTTLDVWKATQADIVAIYHDEYWGAICDSLPDGVDYIVFNNNVLDGPQRSAILLQRALGVTDDGRIGPVTREAIRHASAAELINKLSIASAAFYRSLHQPKFLNGWLNRVAFVQKNAVAMTGALT